MITYLSPFGFLFCSVFPLGLLSLPKQGLPPGPVTRIDSRPLEDFLNVNSTGSPSFRLLNPSMNNLLCKEQGRDGKRKRDHDYYQCFINHLCNFKINIARYSLVPITKYKGFFFFFLKFSKSYAILKSPVAMLAVRIN